MRLIYFILLSVFSSFASAAAAVSTAPFALERRGDQVCRIKKDTAEVCLPLLSSLGVQIDQINVRERIRHYGTFLEMRKNIPDLQLTATAIDAFGGAVFLSPDQINATLNDYEELILRDIALSREPKKALDGSNAYPFLASLRWKSTKSVKPNGTLFIEGYIKARDRLDGAVAIFAPADTSEIRRQKINQLYEVEAFADSGTERKHELLRNIENLGREVHFRAAGTGGKSVEGATLDLLNQIVGPVVFGDAYWLPEMKRSGGNISERLQLR